ncbi:MAG: restriction endonuclease subunit S [Alphaproteobacteria bacterium]
MNFVELGKVVEIKGGGTPDKSNPNYWGGSIPWASVKDFKSTIIENTIDMITEDGVENSATNIIPAGSIIVPTRMAVGKAAINKVDMAINQDLKALFPSPEIDTRFLFHCLLANSQVLERQASGATVKGIKLDVLRALQVPVISMNEQKRIAAILDQADALSQSRRRAITRLNDLSQSIFYEMFGDPRTNLKGMPVEELGQIIKVGSGDGLTAENQNGGDYPVYGGNGVNGWHDAYNVERDTIVIGRVGVYCGAVHVTDRKAWVTDNALIVKLKRDMNISYLSSALKYANLNQYAGRSSQPLVSGTRIYPVKILVPDMNLQKQYEQRITKIKELDYIFNSDRDKIENLFLSLQQRAFRGEL